MPPYSEIEIEAFYDGDCFLCTREVAWLRKRDSHGRIRFTDIAAPGFDANRDAGIPVERLQGRIQARLATGDVVEGVEVFRHLYKIVGFPRLVRLTRLSILSRILDVGYRVFARNRLLFSRRRRGRTCRRPRQGPGCKTT